MCSKTFCYGFLLIFSAAFVFVKFETEQECEPIPKTPQRLNEWKVYRNGKGKCISFLNVQVSKELVLRRFQLATYVGEWFLDQRHGSQGVFTSNSGNRYDGEWKEDKMWGSGVATLNDGSTFHGKFANGSVIDIESVHIGQYRGRFQQNPHFENLAFRGHLFSKGLLQFSTDATLNGEWTRALGLTSGALLLPDKSPCSISALPRTAKCASGQERLSVHQRQFCVAPKSRNMTQVESYLEAAEFFHEYCATSLDMLYTSMDFEFLPTLNNNTVTEPSTEPTATTTTERTTKNEKLEL